MGQAAKLQNRSSGQSYKGSTIVNYVSTVVPDYEIAYIMTLDF